MMLPTKWRSQSTTSTPLGGAQEEVLEDLMHPALHSQLNMVFLLLLQLILINYCIQVLKKIKFIIIVHLIFGASNYFLNK